MVPAIEFINDNFYFYKSINKYESIKKEAAVSSCPFIGLVYVLFQMLLVYGSLLLGQQHRSTEDEHEAHGIEVIEVL